MVGRSRPPHGRRHCMVSAQAEDVSGRKRGRQATKPLNRLAQERGKRTLSRLCLDLRSPAPQQHSTLAVPVVVRPIKRGVTLHVLRIYLGAILRDVASLRQASRSAPTSQTRLHVGARKGNLAGRVNLPPTSPAGSHSGQCGQQGGGEFGCTDRRC